MKNNLRLLWISTTVAFLLSFQYIERYADEKNRYLFFWEWWDGLAIVFSMFLIGLVFYFTYILVCKLKSHQITKIFESAFIAILGLAIIKDIEDLLFKSAKFNLRLKFTMKPFIYFLFATLIYVLCVHLFTKTKKIKNLFLALYLILSPILPIFLINSFAYKTWAASIVRITPNIKLEAQAENTYNTFIFVFDEWSYARSYNAKGLSSTFKNLSQFAETATTFHNAYVHAGATLESLPNIIFQNHHYYDVKNNQLFFKDTQTGEKTLIKEMNSIFSIPQKEGYFTACIGSYHPYAEMLGCDVDFVSSFSAHKLFGNNFLGVTGYHLLKSTNLFFFRFFPQQIKWLDEVSQNYYQLKRTSAVHHCALSIIKEVKIPAFVLLHYSVPHDAFVYNQNGAKNIWQIYDWNLDNYLDNLAYLDRLIGEIVNELKLAGKFDNSLIIMTSDHSWRFDPDFLEGKFAANENRHVPLLIKFPDQAKKDEINDRLDTTALFDRIRLNPSGVGQSYQEK